MSLDIRTRLLRAMAHEPKRLRTFTDADAMLPMPIKHAERFAAELIADGHAQQVGEFFMATEAGLAFLNAKTTVAAPVTWCAASTGSAPWKPKPWIPARDGADEHLQHRSLGR